MTTQDMDARHARAAQMARVARVLRELAEELDDIEACVGDWRSAAVDRFERVQRRIMAQLRVAEELTGARAGYDEASARLHDAASCAEWAWRVASILQTAASALDRRALSMLCEV